jgi:VIT1/CCC1 family predicted Fe2+/Mn2+ transporter
MRLGLRDSERKPDPEPVSTDDRKAVLVGLVLWVVALVVLGFFFGVLTGADAIWVFWTAVAGVALGSVGLVFLQFKRR